MLSIPISGAKLGPKLGSFSLWSEGLTYLELVPWYTPTIVRSVTASKSPCATQRIRMRDEIV